MAGAAPESWAPGLVLEDRYRLERAVGSGGFSTVFEATHLVLGIRVAIKVLRFPEGDDTERRGEFLAAFTDEARLLTRLRHENVVRTLDQGIASPEGRATPYLVLEWCGDRSLKQHLEGRGALPIQDALAIVLGIADGAAHAHEIGVAHRDIKPQNVMLAPSSDGRLVPRLIDFGIGKLFDAGDLGGSGATVTRSGAAPFTPAYAAPEQIAGARTGPWTDVHAIGLLLVEMLTGKAPYSVPGSSGLGPVDPARPSPRAFGVDAGELEPIIARAVAIRPADRYANAGELAAALRRAAGSKAVSSRPASRAESAPPALGDATEQPISQTLPAPEGAIGAAPSGRRRTVMLAALGVAGASAIAALAYFARDPAVATEPPPPSAGATAQAATASPTPAASSSAAPVRTARPLSEMTIDELEARVKKSGLRVTAKQGRSKKPADYMITYEHQDKTAYAYLIELQMPAELPKEQYAISMLPTIKQWVDLDRAQSQGLVYGILGNWVLCIAGFDAATTAKAFDALAEGFELEARGDSFSGPDPATVPKDSRVLWRAEKLEKMTWAELDLRIRATGAGAASKESAAGFWFSVELGGKKGDVELIAKRVNEPGPPSAPPKPTWEARLASLRARRIPFAYVEDEKVVALSSGQGEIGSADFFKKVFDGLKLEPKAEPGP